MSSPWLQADEDVRAAPRILAVSPKIAWALQPRNACSIHVCPWPSPVCLPFSHMFGRALLHLTPKLRVSLALMDLLSTCPKTLGSLVEGTGLVAMPRHCAAWWVLALGGCPCMEQ